MVKVIIITKIIKTMNQKRNKIIIVINQKNQTMKWRNNVMVQKMSMNKSDNDIKENCYQKVKCFYIVD